MHTPDNLLNTAVSATTAVIAAGGVAYALHRARIDGTDGIAQRLPLAVATTAFLFAAQMVNFPVLPGTSGHLIGAALAVALIGPWLAVLSVSLVLTVQAVVFADGGLTALGTNVVLMALVGVGVASGTMALVRKVVGRSAPRLAATLGAAASVPASALVLAVLFAIGGVRQVPFAEFLGSMVGVHALIGLGEAVVTVLVLSAVMAFASGLAAADERLVQRHRTTLGVAGVGAAAVVAAVVLSAIASTSPDGLEAVSNAYDLSALVAPHAFEGSLFAEYGAAAGLPVALAGAVGLVVTAASARLLVAVIGRRSPSPVATA